ncbi:ABC transporter permease [Ruthenibacterium lactatiformans]|uniref:ABC transporter permease n=1 Tax=Ruthenibacterium lactatiformans TaxID=1550024 RepID=UPI002941C580|nr:ABC transporter permease subunit [Ruthenibacterium lactatiformans]
MAQKAVKPLGLSKKKGIFRRELPFYLMLIPGVLFALVFSYGPMFGLVMAFQDFTPLKSFENSPWVGLQNFRDMLALPTFWSVVRNTLVISLSKIVLRLLVPLVIALLLNEVINEKFKRVAQTVFFLPYFLSWAVMGGILRSLFQYDGMVNSVLTSLGMERIMFLGSNTWFPIIVILSDVWKDMGYNMIIFLAAITNVDPALNESAALDGANRWQQIWNITLPTIRPIVVMLLVLSLGSVLSAGLDQVMLLYNPMVYESGDIIDTLVYRLGLVNHQWSLSAAVGLMKSVISFVLVVLSYRVATKRFDYQVF